MKKTIARAARWLGVQTTKLLAESMAKHINIPERIQAVTPADPRQARWKRERDNYRLIGVGGYFVYELRADAGTDDDGHWLCPTCFDQGHQLSVLQQREEDIWKCDVCGFEALTDEAPWVWADDE